MKPQIDKKQFSLEQIAPYYHNPEVCGYDKETEKCCYKTKDGKMCVAGKNMRAEFIEIADSSDGIWGILERNEEEFVFKNDVVGILEWNEWSYLQQIHDGIAKQDYKIIQEYITKLDLFTLSELENFTA